MSKGGHTLLAVLGATMVFLVPELQRWLIYDREAILTGEIWRLGTGHWVHFSASHLAYDLLALGIAGLVLETRDTSHWPWLLWLAPWVIGLGLFVLAPGMAYYGGLSGVATAAVAYLAVDGLKEKSSWRWAYGMLLLGVVVKPILEWETGTALLVSSQSHVVMPESHLLGALCAVVMAVVIPVNFRTSRNLKVAATQRTRLN
jgi:rhomboid family GlyGly-CTERM serine protease